jgi:peptide/nickel transport system substrate-binding protein
MVMIALIMSATTAFAAGSSDRPAAVSTLILADSTDAASLDPHVQNDGQSEQVVAMLYSTLLKFEADGRIVPDLAESWEVSADSRTWTFKLRQGVKFHNGKEMTAADVKATYERFMADDADGKRLVVKNITKMFSSVVVKDKYTVSITTDKPYGPMMSLLCNRSLAIMDADVFRKFGLDKGAKAESVIGTGPYKMVSWKKDEEIVLERFADYFGEPAKTERLIFRVIPEATSRVIALENGEVDFVKQFPSEDLDRLKNSPKTQVFEAASVGARLFRFGANDPIIRNPKVRQAIVYAIDRKAIINGLFPGQAVDTTGPLAPVVWGYVNLGVINRDLAKARQLLVEAGYPNGFRTKIVTTPRYAKGVEMAEALSAQLKDVGIIADIEVLEWSVILPLWSGVTPQVFNQPIFVMGAGTSMMDADGGLRGLYTTTETGTNERNYGFYSNAEVDRLVNGAMSETDPVKRLAMYKRAQEILYLEDPVAIWLFDRPTTVAASSKVKGVEINGIGLVHYHKMYKE